MERTDENGRWIELQPGTWALIDPSPAFEADRARIRAQKIIEQPSLESILVKKGQLNEADFVGVEK